MTSDVTIFGAGLFGLGVAWACASRGARVRVVDPAGPGAGASGGLVGALAPHAPENWSAAKAFQLDALCMAEGFWAEVARIGGIDPGYASCGRLQPVADDAALARNRDRAVAAAAHWRGQGAWQVIRATGAAWEPKSPTGWLVHDTLTGRVSPRAACAALVAAIRARRGEIVTEAPASDGPQVWATGWRGLERLSVETGCPMGGGEKGQALRLAPRPPRFSARPPRFSARPPPFSARPPPPKRAPPAHPPASGAGAMATQAPVIMGPGLFIVPHADGTVAVGSTAERVWDDPTATDGQLDAVLERARALVPALSGLPVVERWAGVRPRSATRRPLLGPHPTRPGVFLANGGFKIGVALAPLAGVLLADLILEGRDRIPPEFRPETRA
jgi:glycine oxidase